MTDTTDKTEPNEKRRRIAVLFGGESPEHEVSIASASMVADALARLAGVVPVPVYITREGVWHWPRPTGPKKQMSPATRSGDPADAVSARDVVLAALEPESRARHYEPGGLHFAQALIHLTVDEFDTIAIVLHGANGEDGRLQGALELAGLPFTGSGSAASALAMDKPRCQAYLKARGLPVPEFVAVDRASLIDPATTIEILDTIGVPCVVKPANGGSSVGVTIVTSEDALGPALRAAFEFDETVMIEKFISGREFTCTVLEAGEPAGPSRWDAPGTGDSGAGQPAGEAAARVPQARVPAAWVPQAWMPKALPIIEIFPPEGRFFDYDAKYTPGESREVCPAQIDDALAETISRLAIATHMAVGCRGFSRVDFIWPDASADAGAEKVDENRDPLILEINTIPGMTETSLVPQSAAAAGIDFPELMDIIIRQGMR